jgi:oxygen-dependent protoporphyrinogen oxidase
MEREHGSLIAALQTRSQQRTHAQQPIFTSLRRGMASLVEALAAQLPNERITREITPWPLEEGGWRVLAGRPDRSFLFFTTYRTRSERDISEGFDHIIVATPLDVTRSFTGPTGIELKTYFPSAASSAILVAFAWAADVARAFTIPSGFGFLVPQTSAEPEQLLACTFVDQKFPHRAPEGARVMRAFFGGECAESLNSQSDEEIAGAALGQLRNILGPIPEPAFQTVRRWSRSLPQYEVGHLERIAKLEELVAQVPGLHLLGNSYRGVGIPDLIRDARSTARAVAEGL